MKILCKNQSLISLIIAACTAVITITQYCNATYVNKDTFNLVLSALERIENKLDNHIDKGSKK